MYATIGIPFSLCPNRKPYWYANAGPIYIRNPLTLDETNYKLYLSDTGLLFTLAFRDNKAAVNGIYSAILDGKMNLNEGMFFENTIAQELVSTGHRLLFAIFRTEESQKYQEVDFIIGFGSKFIPIESKSAQSGSHKSLDRMMKRYSGKIDRAYVIHSKNLRVDGKTVYVPIYMTEFIE